MSGRGELLELMHTSLVRWHTLQAAGREWRHTARARAAWQRSLEESRSGRHGSVAVFGSAGDAEPLETQQRWQLTVERPDRMRASFQVGDESVTMVRDGPTWWSWSPSRPPSTNAGNPNHQHGTGPGGDLIDPATFLPAVELDVIGRSTFLGRPALQVVARPAVAGPWDEEAFHQRFALHSLGSGADDYVLVVDEERGIVLRAEARLAGEPFRVVEIEQVAFDQPLPAGTFDHPDAAEPVETLRFVPVADLPGAVSHAVLVPEHPPFGLPDASLSLREGNGEEVWDLSINYRSCWDGEENQSFVVTESAHPLPEPPDLEWHRDGDLRFAKDTDFHPAHRRVRVERGGTHVEIRSHSLPMPQLLEIAQSLVRLPSSPPVLRPRQP